jgi:hypothetical protein
MMLPSFVFLDTSTSRHVLEDRWPYAAECDLG